MNIWLAIIISGLITFLMRFSFIFLFGRFKIPEIVRRILRYIPPAVLSAIIFPSLLIRSNGLDISLGNGYLIAGIVSVAVAWITKNTLLTIVAGLATIILIYIL